MSDFFSTRRQSFLTERYYQSLSAHYQDSEIVLRGYLGQPELGTENLSLQASILADNKYELFSLRYTAGVPCETLRDELGDVVAAHEQYQQALSIYEEEAYTAAFYLGEIYDYERLLQLIGLAYLLHRRDLLPRIAKLADTNFYGVDATYEDLLDYGLAERYDTDDISFYEPYNDLVQAMRTDTNTESVADLHRYLLAWYPAMWNAPWYDSHLEMTDAEGVYFGYWAFEAGAIAHLRKLDDNEITHLIYPKDLVAWANANEHLADEPYAPAATKILRAEPASAVPQSGYWSSPAIEGGALKYFAQGSRFPDTRHTEYGDVVWYFDPDKQAPSVPGLR